MSTPVPSEVNYFTGQFLTAGDYAAEQDYQAGMRTRSAAALILPGVVEGLRVTKQAGGNGYTVSAGWAVDGAGRTVIQAHDRNIAAPATTPALLVIAYAERESDPGGRLPLRIVEESRLAWVDPGQTAQSSSAVVLGTYAAPSFTADGRAQAGAREGALRVHNPNTDVVPSIIAWSGSDSADQPVTGLRIDAPSVFVMPPDADTTATVAVDGALGVGVMAPSATLDIVASDVAETGPGTLSSVKEMALGSSPMLTRLAQVGTVLTVTDHRGVAKQAQIRQVLPDGSLVTDAPLNCEAASYTIQQPFIVLIRPSGDPLRAGLSVTRSADVGFGVSNPQARLHVGGGDLALTGQGRRITFTGAGGLADAATANRVAFTPEAPALAFHRTDGSICFLPGRSAGGGPVGTVLLASGDVGIGTATPRARLDVAGDLHVLSGGLIFPDGTVQTTAEVSIPIGTVIDWWRGDTTLQVPESYMICDGSICGDKASPFHGKPVPDLADLFVFGAADTAQAGRLDGADLHAHGYAVPSHVHAFPHTHPDLKGETGPADDSAGMAGASDSNAQCNHRHTFTATVAQANRTSTLPNSDYGTAATTEQASLMPPYVGLLKIIRIK